MSKKLNASTPTRLATTAVIILLAAAAATFLVDKTEASPQTESPLNTLAQGRPTSTPSV